MGVYPKADPSEGGDDEKRDRARERVGEREARGGGFVRGGAREEAEEAEEARPATGGCFGGGCCDGNAGGVG